MNTPATASASDYEVQNQHEKGRDLCFPVTAAIVVAAVAAYDVMGILFLVRDGDVMRFCRATSSKVHVIWQTSLWTYVLASLVAATMVAFGMTFLVPVQRTNSELRRYLSGISKGHLGTNRSPYQSLPDWDLLAIGAAFIASGLYLCLMAFWGYFELFVARVWCDDKKTAFEELDLWKFGRVSFWMQAIGGIVVITSGVLYLIMPFVMELLSPASPGAASKGAHRIGSYNAERDKHAEDARRFQP